MTAPSSSSAPPPGNERLGTWLRGKYRLDAVLGVGGMAVVFAVTHRNGRRFALKMLHPELSGRSDLRKRFLREGYIANAVGHSGAVAVLDDDLAEDGSAFLVMELLDGQGLDTLMGHHPGGIAFAPALSLAYQLLDVLAAAHAKNIVHRDIKPGNLFATRKGELKVLDFGIARLQEPEGTATTRTGMTMGTPAFMAPEQAMGRPIDARADLFSVGATLFTILSGRFVHQGDTGQELMVKAATEPAPPLGSIAPHIPPVVTACVDRALAFGITERWQSAEIMQAAIADAFHSLMGGEVSGTHLAAIVTHSQVSEIYASAPEGTPPGAPLESPLPAPPRAPTMPFPGLSRGRSSDPLAAGHDGALREEKASPITGEPVSATQQRAALGATPPPASPRKTALLAGFIAATLVALATTAVILGLKVSGHHEGALPPSAPTPVTAAAPPPNATALVVPPAPPQLQPAIATAPSEVRDVPATPASHAVVRAPAPPLRTPATGPDAGAHRTEPSLKVDPWATP